MKHPDTLSINWIGLWLLALVILAAFASPARANLGGDCIEFDTELVSLNLSGGPYPMPLAADPGNALGDSVEGYGFVDSEVTITLSSQRLASPGPASTGKAFAHGGIEPQAATANAGGGCGDEPVDPPVLDGELFFIDSFFDVFFDITVTDVDTRAGRDFAGQPDGASIFIPDNGPANMQSFHEAVFDQDAPNFGLIPPPEVAPYIGHFLIEIPLGGDINGNGENDKIKFTIATHAAGDGNRTFTTLPDGTVIDGFDSAAFLAGAVVDESTDPPFTIGTTIGPCDPNFPFDPNCAPAFSGPGALTGPTTATSTLLNPPLDSDGDGIPDTDDACPDSDLGPTVVIDGCDSGVENVLFDDGCTIADQFAMLDKTDPGYKKQVKNLLKQLKKDGVISGKDKKALKNCALPKKKGSKGSKGS